MLTEFLLGKIPSFTSIIKILASVAAYCICAELRTSVVDQKFYHDIKVNERNRLAFKDCAVGYGNYSQPGSSKIRVKSKYLFYIFYFKVF
jgi:hypothetical protein